MAPREKQIRPEVVTGMGWPATENPRNRTLVLQLVSNPCGKVLEVALRIGDQQRLPHKDDVQPVPRDRSPVIAP